MEGSSAQEGQGTTEPDAGGTREKGRIHQVTIARVENGTRQPSMDLLQRLAKALKVKVGELLK